MLCNCERNSSVANIEIICIIVLPDGSNRRTVYSGINYPMNIFALSEQTGDFALSEQTGNFALSEQTGNFAYQNKQVTLLIRTNR